MKLSIVPVFLALALTQAAPTPAPASLEKRATVQGFDISHYQANVDFKAAYNSGARFVIIKVGHTLAAGYLSSLLGLLDLLSFPPLFQFSCSSISIYRTSC